MAWRAGWSRWAALGTGLGGALCAAGAPRLAEARGAREAREQPPPPLWDADWDKCTAERERKPEAPEPVRWLVLVRHGQYNYVSRSKFPGWSEAARLRWDNANDLTKLGREQATRTGVRIAEFAAAKNLKVDAVYYSDQKRATETAELIVQQLSKYEQPAGEGSELADAESFGFHMDQMLREGAPVKPVPGGFNPSERTCYEDGARIEAAFRRYFHRPSPEQERDSLEVLVCHGNVIRYFVCRALQIDPKAWLRFAVFNCGITILRISSSGSVSIMSVGDTGHIPADLVTYS